MIPYVEPRQNLICERLSVLSVTGFANDCRRIVF